MTFKCINSYFCTENFVTHTKNMCVYTCSLKFSDLLPETHLSFYLALSKIFHTICTLQILFMERKRHKILKNKIKRYILFTPLIQSFIMKRMQNSSLCTVIQPCLAILNACTFIMFISLCLNYPPFGNFTSVIVSLHLNFGFLSLNKHFSFILSILHSFRYILH